MHRSVSLTLLGILPLALAGCGSIDRAAHVASGYVSHQLCSAAFVTGVEPEQYYREAIAPTLQPVGYLARHAVDLERRSVETSFAGLASARAVHRGALGCLVQAGEAPAPVALPAYEPVPARQPDIAVSPEVVEPQQPALKEALDRAFQENPQPPFRSTKAIVIVRDGRVVAERYAPGYGVDTPLLGWSMTKSVTNALLGILVRQGKLDMNAPAPIAAWADPNDPRRTITPDNLLRMNSGLDIGDSLTAQASTAFDPTAYMVFGGVPDMAAFAEKAPLKAAPGTLWNYTNANTMLLSRLIRERTGGRWEGLFVASDEQGCWRLLGTTRGKLQPGESITLMDSSGRDAIELRPGPGRRKVAPFRQVPRSTPQPVHGAVIISRRASPGPAASPQRAPHPFRGVLERLPKPDRERLVEEATRLRLGEHREQRIDAGFHGTLAQQIRAEAVDGADMRLFQVAQCLFEARACLRIVVRRLASVFQLLPEPQFELPCRLFRERDRDDRRQDRKSTRLNSSHVSESRMPSSA